ncbi:hypothetical protein DSO57_1012762 [Entomophthora muscae]|uniref:Uncharacterized protein n=1 Tax=Entomophthora muscae TaxID=34485 RepID=A0ACC2TGM0_9FUNG|nr:hypothetical protein DSO57_1012762 [Entomophthora muscae]
MCPLAHSMVAHRPDVDGAECLLSAAIPCVLLWSPFRVAVPVIHWAAPWWFISPGWEPNLVSLAPSLAVRVIASQGPKIEAQDGVQTPALGRQAKARATVKARWGIQTPNRPPGQAKAVSNCPGLFGQFKAAQSRVPFWGQL